MTATNTALVKEAHNRGYFVEWVRLRRPQEAATAAANLAAARRSPSAGKLTA
jgi:hypothetical protein